MKCLVLSALTAALMSTTVFAQQAVNLPAKNPWLTDSVYPTSHHNPAQTDVSPIAGPSASKALGPRDVRIVPKVFVSNPVVTRIGEDRVIYAAGSTGISKILATGDMFEEVAYLPYPGFEALGSPSVSAGLAEQLTAVDAARRSYNDAGILAISPEISKLGFDFTTGANGVYNLVDRDGFHYSVYGGVNVMKVSGGTTAQAQLEIVKTFDITSALPAELAATVTRVLGVGMTYDGNIAVAAPGMVALLSRDLEMLGYVTFPGEFVDNSIAIDQNGIYVVSSENMYKVVWTGKKLSFDEADGGWISPYDTMDGETAVSLGALSRGSGTTPALMGFGDDEDKLVLIADADIKGTKLVAFWRDQIPADFEQKPGTQSRRIADQIRVEISYLTIEPSPAIFGYGVVVINATLPEASPVRGDIYGNAMTAGVTRIAPRGIQKFTWNPDENRFELAWTDLTIDNTDVMVPLISAPSNIVFFANKVGLRYEYVGLDWTNGKLHSRYTFPNDSALYNTWGGIGYFLEDGDLITGGFFGAKRFELSE